MKKKILCVLLAAVLLAVPTMQVKAAGTDVIFKADGTLVTPDGDGGAFSGVVPGDTRSLIIPISNENSHTSDFYLNANVVDKLDAAGTAGGGFEIKLTVGDRVFYDSTSGGDLGLGGLNEDTLITTLANGNSTNLVLSIHFKGEGMDSTTFSNYLNKVGEIDLNFKAGYEDPTGGSKTYRYVTRNGEVKYIKIYDEASPLAAKTGDNFSWILAICAVALGGVLVFLGLKKKEEK